MLHRVISSSNIYSTVMGPLVVVECLNSVSVPQPVDSNDSVSKPINAVSIQSVCVNVEPTFTERPS